MEGVQGAALRTLLKTGQTTESSICQIDEKGGYLFFSHQQGIHIFDIKNARFLDDVKLRGYPGSATCLTGSDELAFVAWGMKVLACATNGKVIFEFDTYLAVEKIERLHVFGYRLWVISGGLINEFQMGGVQISNKKSRSGGSPLQKTEDVSSIILDVSINYSLLILDAKPFLLLLLQNSLIQTFQRKQAEATFKTSAPPTHALVYPAKSNKVLVGTASGGLYYLEVNRKSIKQLWFKDRAIKGKVICMSETQSGLIIFSDSFFQQLDSSFQVTGTEKLSQKVVSAHFVEADLSVYFSCEGGLIQRLAKYQPGQKKEEDPKDQKDKITAQIAHLNAKIALTKAAIANASQPVSTLPKLTQKISLDFRDYCCVLELTCTRPIEKINMTGPVTVLPGDVDIHFSGDDKQLKVYALRFHRSKAAKIKFRYDEQLLKVDKLVSVVLVQNESDRIAINVSINLKSLWQQQKIAAIGAEEFKTHHKLTITGSFRYFQMHFWLASIFPDFGISTDNFDQACFESIVTKAKSTIRYKNQLCEITSEDASIIRLCKAIILQKAGEKEMSLSVSIEASSQATRSLLKRLEPRILHLQALRRKNELLPGLNELKNELESEELLEILSKSSEIQSEFVQAQREEQQLYASLRSVYSSFCQISQTGKRIDEIALQQLLKRFSLQEAERLFGFEKSQMGK